MKQGQILLSNDDNKPLYKIENVTMGGTCELVNVRTNRRESGCFTEPYMIKEMGHYAPDKISNWRKQIQ